MFHNTTSDHLKIIEDVITDNSVLVYKGFPLQFYKNLSKHYPFLSEQASLLKDNKICLEYIENNAQDLISKLFSNIDSVKIILYEELVNLDRNINIELFKCEFLIIVNDLFIDYPNQSTESYLDIEKSIEQNKLDFDENERFNQFYVDSKIYHNVNYVQYPELTQHYSNVRSMNYFNKLIESIRLEGIIIKEIGNQKNYINFPSSDSSYQKFKYDIFFDNPITISNIRIDKHSFKSTDKQVELRKLKYLFDKSKNKLSIFIEELEEQTTYRESLINILHDYWKSDEFRDLLFYKNPSMNNDKMVVSQGNIIEEIVQEVEKAIFNIKFEDIFLTAPTGSGKSLLFQIPAIYIDEKYGKVTIVVSPLKALMYDQVVSLKEKGIHTCAYINSDISFLEREEIIDKIKKGEISIIYMSPELLLSYDLRMFIGDRTVGLFVIDEAHLVTTWGRDFRVDYWYLGNYIAKLRKYSEYNFPVVSLTATAVYTGINDIVFETIGSLNMQIPNLHLGNIRRDEINFDIRDFKFTGGHEEKKIDKTLSQIEEFVKTNKKAILYFPWINHIKNVERSLPKEHKNLIGVFYSSVDKVDKKVIIEQFKEGKKLIILATKAFGMGVDISDIEIIYHHAPSGNLEDYVQEIGRVARSKSIKGFAVTDYCAKDLKFTKILYGLSSIKQYQTKLAIKKINDVYKYKKKRNLLLSVDDFSFIFNENTYDIESKVKSALLLVEKDFIQKYGYNVVVVRPKSLFSVVYAKVDNKIEKEFLKKYGQFCQKVKDPDFSTQYIGKGNSGYKRIVADPNKVYSIQLNQIWEKFFVKDTFPMTKRKYFNNELFEGFEGKIYPRYCVQIRLKSNRDELFTKLNVYFYVIEHALNSFQGKYFTKRELDSALKEQNLNDRVKRTRITDLLLTLYTGYEAIDPNLQNKFIIFKGSGGNIKYRVINHAYQKVRHGTFQQLERMFPDNKKFIFEKYVDIHSKVTKSYIEVSFLLESLDLANYEMSGGMLPLLFIRINDPYKLDNIANDHEYKNNLLHNIDKRHDFSVKIMDTFLSHKFNNQERWNFIEDYFLGKDLVNVDFEKETPGDSESELEVLESNVELETN